MKNAGRKTAIDKYILSFDAHYDLVTIHPWADGNGRMARLLMNMIQFEFGLVPAKIRTESKSRYIEALVRTREQDDKSVFRDFMLEVMIENLKADIEAYVESTGEVLPAVKGKEKSREKIVRLLGEKDGVIIRVGPDKGGHWEVTGGCLL